MGMFVDQPRVILVTRKTLLRKVSEKHGTREQARFYAKMKSASKAMAMLESADDLFNEAMRTVQSAIPPEWRRTVVEREELDRFLFAPDDLIVIVGQDGLVPNTAKYLDGQLVIGINPDPQRYDGVLCPHRAGDMAKLMQWVSHRSAQFAVRKRIMGAATREDGQVLLSLNEIFVGHRSHQSARYLLKTKTSEERHSSSGLICATGTGASGWARSMVSQRAIADPMPLPEEAKLIWLVREPFPSVATGISLDKGFLTKGMELTVVSEMPDGGVIFADGIETDFLEFSSGQSVKLGIASQTLNLVMRAS